MRALGIRSIHVIILFFTAVHLILAAQETVPSTSVIPVQLRGLRSVNVIVYIGIDIPEPKSIEQRIQEIAKKMLSSAGLSLNGEQGAILSIKVTLYPIYPIDGVALTDYALLQVRTQLSEKVALTRDPSLKTPSGAITWERSWVALKAFPCLECYILEEVTDQLDWFCTDLQTAAR